MSLPLLGTAISISTISNLAVLTQGLLGRLANRWYHVLMKCAFGITPPFFFFLKEKHLPCGALHKPKYGHFGSVYA